MSTPTTATATLPHYAAGYPFAHQSSYRSSLSGPNSSRLGPTSVSSPSSTNTYSPYSPSAASSSLSHLPPATVVNGLAVGAIHTQHQTHQNHQNHQNYQNHLAQSHSRQAPQHYHSASSTTTTTTTTQNYPQNHSTYSHDHDRGHGFTQQSQQSQQQQSHTLPVPGGLHHQQQAHDTAISPPSFSTVASSTTLPPPRLSRSHGTPTAAPMDAASMHAAMGSQHTNSSSESLPPRKRRRSGPPDWDTFYRNGLPQEVIVIEDSPERDSHANGDHAETSGVASYANGSAARPNGTTVASNNGTAVAYHYDQTTGAAAPVSDGSDHHVAKKRRRQDPEPLPPASSLIANAGSAARYDPVQYYASGSTISSERTNSNSNSSLYTTTGTVASNTAGTSLASNGNGNGQYEYETATQKRKRTTRQQVANESKKRDRDAAAQGPPFANYRPPPLPPVKAPDVEVKVIRDSAQHKNVKVDDDDGHYLVAPDADLTKRYQIVKLLGQGTFGKVVQARDRERSELVAIKIIRSVQKYRDASRIELRVLETLKANDRENRNRCIHLRECFDYRNHICIVMDLLGQSVFDFLKGNGFVPFPNSQIQNFARQLFTSVAFLHDLQLIHTDLKPENILLVDATYQTFTYNRKIPSSSSTVARQATQRRVLLDTEIRLIDFGSATFQDEYHSSVVSTRHYRAPEIILGLGWSFPCDIWSIGCILVEFFTGDALFQTHDNLEHLAMMEAVCDARIDSHLVQQVAKSTRHGGNPASKYFKRTKLDYPNEDTTRASRRFVKAMKKLQDIFPNNSTFLRNFLDLLKRIFIYDPSQRITAKQALQHPWFREIAVQDDGTEAAKIRLERARTARERAEQRAAARTSQVHV
ncbi:protein kinase [Ophiostoma piceae UAMH 11346]|uniref:dual-specificity kinase n=1 Tax=Ophiostoma piceae (strain UAMH 11346) TaxID=1262450 RepID=S3CEG2_OPHP1|nr:protein kinase [Ophiostoma piceae UAMH 11346]